MEWPDGFFVKEISMALEKAIKQPDGVVTNYHRILFLQTTVNRQNSIAVLSYVDTASRADEMATPSMQPYRRSKSYETEYDETMTIESAYEFLKTLPDFEGAIDA